MKSIAIPQGPNPVFTQDPMRALHTKNPASMQNPAATFKTMQTILNSPDCNCACVGPNQSVMNHDK